MPALGTVGRTREVVWFNDADFALERFDRRPLNLVSPALPLPPCTERYCCVQEGLCFYAAAARGGGRLLLGGRAGAPPYMHACAFTPQPVCAGVRMSTG